MPTRDGFTQDRQHYDPCHVSRPDAHHADQAGREFDSPVFRQGGLRKFLHFKPIPGEQERTITLEPPAVLIGRLVSPGENHCATCRSTAITRWIQLFPQLRRGPMPKADFASNSRAADRLNSCRSDRFISFAHGLMVEAGEQIDFGELDITTVGDRATVTAKTPPKRTPQPGGNAVRASLPAKRVEG